MNLDKFDPKVVEEVSEKTVISTIAHSKQEYFGENSQINPEALEIAKELQLTKKEQD
jgi:hypothetical protein